MGGSKGPAPKIPPHRQRIHISVASTAPPTRPRCVEVGGGGATRPRPKAPPKAPTLSEPRSSESIRVRPSPLRFRACIAEARTSRNNSRNKAQQTAASRNRPRRGRDPAQ